MAGLLQDWVTAQARRRPDACAVVCEGTRLTYGQLDALSTQLASVLKASGCQRGDRVAMLMPKSTTAIASILGIYKADCIYVPLDPSSPVSRLAKILQSCENRCLLAAGPVHELVDDLRGHQLGGATMSVGWLGRSGAAPADFTLDDVMAAPVAEVPSRNTTHDPAHILFTSGSTGTPKGVVITHANVIRFVDWAVRYFGLTASDRVSGHPPLHFDLSFFDICGTFAAGGELHLVPAELNLLPTRLASLIRQAELTQWFSVPSVLNYLARFDAVRFDDFPALKRVLWCGEVLPTPTLIYWMTRLPHVTFTNLYGPTETTIASSYHTIHRCPEDPKSAMPIGRACGGEELLVLDETLRPLPQGQVGDLYIAGDGLAQGYWRDRERTDAVFLPHPRRPSERIYKTGDLASVGRDGLVYFHGRSDTQIKSRGYRIELGEIEAALGSLASVHECAVVAVNTDGFEGAVICCAYVPPAGASPTPAALRGELSKLLPSYMIPSRWMPLDVFPRNANGKIDRGRLREAFAMPQHV